MRYAILQSDVRSSVSISMSMLLTIKCQTDMNLLQALYHCVPAGIAPSISLTCHHVWQCLQFRRTKRCLSAEVAPNKGNIGEVRHKCTGANTAETRTLRTVKSPPAVPVSIFGGREVGVGGISDAESCRWTTGQHRILRKAPESGV